MIVPSVAHPFLRNRRKDVAMTRLVLYSQDSKLLPLLRSALAPRFDVKLESSKERIKQIAARGDVDLLVLDFDRNYSSFEQQVLFLGEVAGARVPIVVMTDDLRRSRSRREEMSICLSWISTATTPPSNSRFCFSARSRAPAFRSW